MHFGVKCWHLSSIRASVRQTWRMFSATTPAFIELTPWESPSWAKSLKNLPKHKLKLCHAPTPIHRWAVPGAPTDCEVFIKRDDMTGSTLSGNKVRKLEFLFADAVASGCCHVITCGGSQSNHCCATAAAAAQAGLQCHLFLRAPPARNDGSKCSGNLLLDRMFGAKIYLVPPKAAYKVDIKPRMEALAEHIKSKSGESCRLVEVGGSDAVGLYGYIDAFRELEQQGGLERFDDVVFACGSGGTAEGLAVANHLAGGRLKIHGVAVSDNAAYFHSHAAEVFTEAGLAARPADIMDIVDGYKGRGYGLSTPEEQEFILEVSRRTGMTLDTTYTGKAAYGMVQELHNNPARFRGSRILFIHTGGIYGLFDGTINKAIEERGELSEWMEIDNPPFAR